MFVCANLIERALANSHIVRAKTGAIETLIHTRTLRPAIIAKAADLTVDRRRLGESFGC